MWARSMLRRHVAATVLLVVLVAGAAGLVVAAVAGARRADGSVARFAATNRQFDATVFMCPPGVDPNGFTSQYQMTTACLNERNATAASRQLARTEGVEAVNIGGYFVIGVLDGESPNGWGRITLLTAAFGDDGTLISGRPNLVEGRDIDPAADDEVLLTERAATSLGARVGTRLTLVSWPIERLDEAVNGGLDPDPDTAVDVRVVGIGRFQSDLTIGEVSDVSGNYLGGEIHTGGATGRAVAGFANYGVATVVRLRGGAAGVQAFSARLGELWSDRMFNLEPSSTTLGDYGSAERRIDTERSGTLAFAGIAALATCGFIGLLLLRQLRREQVEARALHDLGMQRRDLVVASLLRAAWIAVPAAALAVAIAAALSPLTPVGLARRAEPDLGVYADTPALALGAVTILLFVGAVAWLTPVVALRPEATPTGRAGAASALALRLGAVPRVGLSFLRRSWPRVAVGVTAIAIASVVTAAVSIASVDRVADRPELFGAWWDADLGDFADADTFAEGAAIVAADDDVVDLAGFTSQSDTATVNDRPVDLTAYWPEKGSVDPVITRGRAPSSLDEIALGEQVVDDLGVEVGDEVHLASVRGTGDVDRTVTLTGTVLFIDPVTVTDQVGNGGYVTGDLLDELSGGAPQRLLARFAPGADVDEVIERLARTFPGPIRPVAPPEDIRNLETLRLLPWLLAGLVAILSAMTLAHALAVMVQQRRRDLAILSVFGLRRRAVRGVTGCSTLVMAVAAVVVGVPLGLVGGRLVWQWLASTIGVEAGPVRPWLAPVEAAAVALVVPQAVNLVATRKLTMLRPAELLRTE
jgi:hypothetical protein